MDSATLSVTGGTPLSGAITLEMLVATFHEWRIFEAGGRLFAFLSGVSSSAAGPDSLLCHALTAGSPGEMAELLCLQARYRRMSAAELREAWLEHISINTLGFIIVAMFVTAWAIAAATWRLGRIEERWTRRNAETQAARP